MKTVFHYNYDASMEFQSDKFYFNCPQLSLLTYSRTVAVNVTNYRVMIVKGKITTLRTSSSTEWGPASASVKVGLCTSANSYNFTVSNSFASPSTYGATISNVDFIIATDISSYTGNYYPCFSIEAASGITNQLAQGYLYEFYLL